MWLGSLKSNLGHAQAAAGVAGVIKMVMAIQNGVLPKTLHLDAPSPQVDWSAGAVELLAEARSWPESGEPRRVGVSSFGVSGTNAHVVLEQVSDGPEAGPPTVRDAPLPIVPLLLSSRDDAGLQAQAGQLRQFLAGRPELALADLGLSSTTRAALEHRAVVLATDRAVLNRALTALARGESDAALVRGTVSEGRLAFVFTGQGAQRIGMGAELSGRYPVFAVAYDQVCEQLDARLGRSLRAVIDGEPELLAQTGFAQPALFAVQIALLALLTSWGVTPDLVAGHSIGELAAAQAAGVLDLADAATLVVARGRLMQALPAGGGMLAVGASEAAVVAGLAEAGVALDLAAVNGPASVVLSGAEAGLEAYAALAAERGWKTSRLRTSHAFHSALMDPMLAEFDSVVRGLSFAEPSVAAISTVTGAPVEAGQWSDPGYWVAQVRRPVRFVDAVSALAARGATRFLEVGPDGVLTAMAQNCLSDVASSNGPGGPVFASMLRRDRDETVTAVTAVGTLFAHGTRVNWPAVFTGAGARRVDLPTYAFQRQRYWLRSAAPTGVSATTRNRFGSDAWRYQEVWKPVPDAQTAVTLPGSWLLIGPAADPRAGAVEVAIREHGGRVIRLPADPDQSDQPGRWRRDSLAARLRALPEQDLSGVVLIATDGENPDHTDQIVPAAVLDTLALGQALGDAGLPAALWIVTRGAICASHSDRLVGIGQAQVWALGRVIALEHPDRWGGLLDLPERSGPRTSPRIAAVLAGLNAGTSDARQPKSGEDQVAIRATGLLVRRIEHRPAGDTGDGWQPRDTVLITGGTGALGAHVARWAAANGAGHLVLAGRRGPAAESATELGRELRELGARVSIVACDVADRSALAALLESLSGERISAVVHAAGIGHAAALGNLDAGVLSTVLSGKTSGAQHLDDLLAGTELDAFIVFSSIAAAWGSGYGGAYAVANAGLDALVQQRRHRGQAGTSLAWGPWAGAGLATVGSTEDDLRRRGLLALDPGLAVDLLRRAVGSGPASTIVADVEWDTFAATFSAGRRRPLIEDLPELRDRTVEAGPRTVTGWHLRLAALPAVERQVALLELVRDQAAVVLGFASGGSIVPGRPFRELGFDSLTAVELRNRLGAETGLRLTPTLVFDYPTAEGLAQYLEAEVFSPAQVRAARITVPVDDDDPIVIVATACRFPGGISSPEDLWDVVTSGTDVIGPFPQNRGWDLDWLHSPDPERPGTSITAHGGFLHEADLFDHQLFGISRREALAMDPQQRLLLETSWEAFERAGLNPRSVGGSRQGVVGVFIGTTSQGYPALLEHTPEDVAGYIGIGSAGSVASGRIAYSFGLEGPALTIDTACSSSLVALHLAAQSLRRGECDLALAGGGHRDGHSGHVHRVQPAARAGHRRAVQVLLGHRRRHRLVRRGRRPAGGAVVRRAAARPAGAGGTARQRGEPGRRLERADRAERPVPAAGDQARRWSGARPGTRARSTSSRRTAPAPRLGDPIEAQALIATYGQGSGRREATLAGLGQIQHRAHPVRVRRRRADQDDHGDPGGRAAADAACRRPDAERGLVGRCRRTTHPGTRLAGRRPPAAGRDLLVRGERDQRPRHPRGATRTGAG